jgi:flagellin-specific chaperone FliS
MLESAKTFDELLELRKFLLVNVEYNAMYKNLKNEYYEMLCVAFNNEFHDVNITTKVFEENYLNIPKLYNIFKNAVAILDRKKGQKYQHILKPLLTRELYSDNVFNTHTSSDISTISFLISLYDYINARITRDVVNVNCWILFFLMEFLHLMKMNNKLSALCNENFANIAKNRLLYIESIHWPHMLPPESAYRIQRLVGEMLAQW